MNKRGENTLQVWLDAVALARYTMEITANKKSFPARYDETTANIINYLRRNCSGRGAPRKAEKHWQTLTEGARHGSQQGR